MLRLRYALPFLGLFFAQPVAAQAIPQEVIDHAASRHAVFQKKGGMAAVEQGLAECWEKAEQQATFVAAVYCSAYNFTAANFDRQVMSQLKAEPTLSMADANRRARRALLTAGVSEGRVPLVMDEIRKRVIAATEKRF